PAGTAAGPADRRAGQADGPEPAELGSARSARSSRWASCAFLQSACSRSLVRSIIDNTFEFRTCDRTVAHAADDRTRHRQVPAAPGPARRRHTSNTCLISRQKEATFGHMSDSDTPDADSDRP